MKPANPLEFLLGFPVVYCNFLVLRLVLVGAIGFTSVVVVILCERMRFSKLLVILIDCM